MNLQFQTTKCAFFENLAGPPQTLEQTKEVKLPEGMPDIGRVICVWGQVILRGKEWRQDSVSATGGVMVWILYTPEEEDRVLTVAEWIPVQMKWDIRDSLQDGKIRICWDLRWLDARVLSARKLQVRVSVAGSAEALSEREEPVFQPGEVPADVELLEMNYPFQLITQTGERSVSLDEELSMGETQPAAEAILAYHMDPQVTEAQVVNDRIVFRGNLCLQVLYRDGEGAVHCWDHSLPFSQFADLGGSCGEDAKANVEAAVTSMELDLGDDGNLRLRCTLLGQYVVEERKMIQLVQDAYSPRRPVEPRMSALELPAVLDSRNQTLQPEASVPQTAQRIVHARFLPDLVRKSAVAEGTQCSVPGQFQVLFYDTSGSLQSAAARWEGALNYPGDSGCEIDCRVGRPVLFDPVPGEEAISLRCQLPVTCESRGGDGIAMVTDLQVGEEQADSQDRPALILRKVGADRLWDIAKASGSTVASICQANGITDTPDPDRVLLIPVV